MASKASKSLHGATRRKLILLGTATAAGTLFAAGLARAQLRACAAP